ncbi:hypothetical protein TELCIR_21874 [Teladorsagia circumcincta]|uniref:alanine--tRNA ligase n=1 Tax=Teladorsagia circumcincta TaxID=45464 RepID=A0A2G9TFK0_TELCI|nr:hypothetical protein TELCIR_21874 [Teladorsagia circumcincta]
MSCITLFVVSWSIPITKPLVAPDRLRFDFDKQARTIKQVKEGEEIVQSIVETHEPVYAKRAPLPRACEIAGLKAMLSDENYPDAVGVLCVGTPVEELIANPKRGTGLKTIVEFCGGTSMGTVWWIIFDFVDNVGLIGHMVILSEEAKKPWAKEHRILALSRAEAVRGTHRAEKLAV